jgi:hypothetical protein
MRWSDITPEQRKRIVDAAATRLAVSDDEDAEVPAVTQTTIADLADYARGRRMRRSEAEIRMALRTDPAMRDAFDRLFDHYAKVSIPLAMAASSGEVRRRRQADMGVEIEWIESSAEPNTMFVRIHAPSSIRPVSELIMRGEEGEMRKITLVDDGDEIEVLVDRDSLEFTMLVSEGTKLWLR